MVLDEADRMLDLGLRDQVQAVRSFLLQGGPSPQPDHPPPALQVRRFICMGYALCMTRALWLFDLLN